MVLMQPLYQSIANMGQFDHPYQVLGVSLYIGEFSIGADKAEAFSYQSLGAIQITALQIRSQSVPQFFVSPLMTSDYGVKSCAPNLWRGGACCFLLKIGSQPATLSLSPYTDS